MERQSLKAVLHVAKYSKTWNMSTRRQIAPLTD